MYEHGLYTIRGILIYICIYIDIYSIYYIYYIIYILLCFMLSQSIGRSSMQASGPEAYNTEPQTQTVTVNP